MALASARKAPKVSRSLVVASTSTSSQLEQIAELEKRLSTASADLNPLVDLLDILKQDTDPATKNAGKAVKIRLTAAYALHNAFSSLIRQGRIIGKIRAADASEALATVREWTRGRWNDYTNTLCSLVYNHDEAVAVPVLNILMSLLRTTSEFLSQLQTPAAYIFDLALGRDIFRSLLAPPQATQPAVLAEFSTRYLNHCDDIRYYFLKVTAELVDANPAAPFLRDNLMYCLESLTTMPAQETDLNEFWAGRPQNRSNRATKAVSRKAKTNKKRKRAEADAEENEITSTGIFDDTDSDEADDTAVSAAGKAAIRGQHDLLSLAAHRRMFAAAWRAFLSLPLTEEDVKRVLVMLHRQVMPHLLEPGMLIDFLADCCDYGGTVSLLALNGMFTLVTKHRLDYPNFYRNVYRLLDAQVMHVRYRPRFLRMLDLFLSSTHLPTALVASFVKRLARLCLSAPPAAIISIIPMIYNLLKRHPACMVLIHSTSSVVDDEQYEDPYNSLEADPLLTGAIDSSLWELATLRKHYLASISTLAKVFEEAFTKPNYDLEDFLDHAYSTLIESETQRTIKKAPAMNALPRGDALKYIFPESENGLLENGSSEDALLRLETSADVVGRLWRFT